MSDKDITDIRIPKAFQELFKPMRYKVYWGGRGSGKSQSFALALIVRAYNEPLRVLCAREFQTSISDSVHKLLADMIREYNLEDVYDITQTAIRNKVNGSEFIFKGLRHNINEIKSTQGVDICWVEEAEKVSDNSWELLIPTIRKPGSEIWVSFNAKHPSDATYIRMVMRADEDFIVRKVSWRDNPFFPEVLDKERRKLEKDDHESYMHIWEGEFDTRYNGDVYARWVPTDRISNMVKHDPNYPVYTSWDLGWGDATSIWFFQVGGGEIFFIDHYEDNLEDTHFYCEVLLGRKIVIDYINTETKAVEKWHLGDVIPEHEHRQAYRYADYHWVPHDAENDLQAASGRDMITQAKVFGIKMMSYPKASHKVNQEAARKTLKKAWFNGERCQAGIKSLMEYHYKWDENRNEFGKEPYHNWASHSCDAFELASRIWQERSATVKELNARDRLNTFKRLRTENNLDVGDPYRIKSVGK